MLARMSGAWELTDLGFSALAVAKNVEFAIAAVVVQSDAAHQLNSVVRMSAADGFSAYVAAVVVAALQRRRPRLKVVTVTMPALQHRSGLDIEVVAGKPQVHRAEAVELGQYVLGIYAPRPLVLEMREVLT